MLHVQPYEPALLVQNAFASHSCTPLVHSLMSEHLWPEPE